MDDVDLVPAALAEDDATAAAIVEALGEGWTHGRVDRTGAPVYDLTGPIDECVHITLLIDRVLVQSCSPGGITVGDTRRLRLEIGMSLTKPPARIAREIERRLLPEYRAALVDLRAQQVEQDAADHRQAVLIAAVEALLCPLGEVHRPGHRRDVIVAGRYSDAVDWESRHMGEGSRTEVTVRLRPRLVPALARFVAQLVQAPPPAEPTDLQGALAAQAVLWQRAREDLYRDEIDDSDDVAADAESRVYGEAAEFLRRMLAEHPAPAVVDRAVAGAGAGRLASTSSASDG